MVAKFFTRTTVALRACGTPGVLTASHKVIMSSIISGRNGDRLEDAKSLARRRGAFIWWMSRRAAYNVSDRSKTWSLTARGNSSLWCLNEDTLTSRYESSNGVGGGAWSEATAAPVSD